MNEWMSEENMLDLDDLQLSLLRYCLSLTGSSWDAEDLAQETWAKGLRKLGEQGHANPEAFLLRIAKNSWIDACRRNVAQALRNSRLPVAEPATDNGSLVELAAVFELLLKHLTPLQCAVFILRDAMGYSIQEAAALIATSDGAVKAAHHRARRAILKVREELSSDQRNAGTAADEEELRTREAAVAFDMEHRLLRELAQAYEDGDAERFVALMQLNQASSEAVRAIGGFASHTTFRDGMIYNSMTGTMRMSA